MLAQLSLAIIFTTITSVASSNVLGFHLLPTLLGSCDNVYTVKNGDTAERIAADHGITLDQLLMKNRNIFNPDILFIGQRLCVSSNLYNPNCSMEYRIQSGDICYDLANQHKISLQDFTTTYNPGINCDKLTIGSSVCISMFPQEESSQIVITPSGDALTNTEKIPMGTCLGNYTIVAGDDCYEIALKNGMTTFDFLSLNPVLCCTTLRVGSKVCTSGTPYSAQQLGEIRQVLGAACDPLPENEEATATLGEEASTTTTITAKPTSTNAKPNLKATPKPEPAISGSALDAFEAHNWCRSKANVPDIGWSPDLASAASLYAQILASRGCALQHSSGTGQGENLYMSSASENGGASAVHAWCAEGLTINEYNHHSQVAWKESKQVGCAQATGTGGCTVVVCRYFPPGNVIGSQYYS